jgi:hypothetical protein
MALLFTVTNRDKVNVDRIIAEALIELEWHCGVPASVQLPANSGMNSFTERCTEDARKNLLCGILKRRRITHALAEYRR